MHNNVLARMIKEARRRHPGLTPLPLHGKSWLDSFAAFEDGYHYLYYHLSDEERTAHLVAYNVYRGEFIKEDGDE